MPQENHQNQINTAIEARLRKNFSEPDFRAFEILLEKDEEVYLSRGDSEDRVTKLDDETFNVSCALSSNPNWRQEDVGSYKWLVILSQYLDKSAMAVLTAMEMEFGILGEDRHQELEAGVDALVGAGVLDIKEGVLAGAGGEPVDDGV